MKIKKNLAMMKTSWLLLALFFAYGVVGQQYNLSNRWVEIGPVDNPIFKNQSAAGLGPVEFIRISENNPSLMLAGALNGGLFYSNNAGDSWQNAGSDSWNASYCAWAEIHPQDDNVWFGVSMRDSDGGGPGDISKSGGVYRSKNRGLTWESVANYNVFENMTSTIIYGLRFHPTQKNKLYALTSQGLYFTEDCMADNLEWTKVKYLKGGVYDLEATEDFLCFSLKHKGKWQVNISDGQKLLPIPETYLHKNPISHITIEKVKGLFYLFIDFKTAKDEVWQYNPYTKKVTIIYNDGRMIFGGGYTFAVSPHNSNELMVGHNLRVKKWLIEEQKYERLDQNYHVDVECIMFHPTDSNTIYIGTHGGIFKSTTGGQSWEFKSKGMGNTEVLVMSVSETNPELIAVGLNHGGTLMRADWDNSSTYTWKQVNGGDALTPIINPVADSIVYTSNQYSGGGLYYSADTANKNTLLHSRRHFATPGWSMAAKLHPKADSVLFFNYRRYANNKKGNIDVARSVRPHAKEKMEVISNFGASHQLESYKVFGLYTSEFHPDILFAYVLSKEKKKTNHKLFMLPNSLDTSATIASQWVELELPRNGWVGDIVCDPKKWHKMYISYAGGVPVSSAEPDNKGMIYHAKYKRSNYEIRRNWDISASIPSATGGASNMVITENRDMFLATSTGVYFGSKSTLKGGKSWQNLGEDLPNIKVSGLHYHKAYKWLTLSYDGRGVWRYDLNVSENNE